MFFEKKNNNFKELPISWLWAIFICALFVSIVLGSREPLQNIHWDSPNYLYQSKVLHEEPTVSSYLSESREILKTENFISFDKTPRTASILWHFYRFGNILILYAIALLFGTTLISLYAATWLYGIFLALTMLLLIALIISLSELFSESIPRSVLYAASIFSACTYIASYTYTYLGKCLISEIPAMLVSIGAILFLILALQKRKVFLAFLSGFLVVISYIIRWELVWIYATFLLATIIVLFKYNRKRLYWPVIITSLGTALFFYIVYSITFYPITKLKFYLKFLKINLSLHHLDLTGSFTFLSRLTAAGSTLWFGWFISLCFLKWYKLVQFSFIWLILLLLPSLLSSNYPVELRLYYYLILPLMIGSAIGWLGLFDLWKKKKGKYRFVIILSILLVIMIIGISRPGIYSYFRKFPAGWRLQYIRKYFSPSKYEMIRYNPDELLQISRVVYGGNERTVLIYERPSKGLSDITWEHRALIEYFGPISKKNMVVYSDDPTAQNIEYYKNRSIRIFVLRPKKDAGRERMVYPAGIKEAQVLETAHYRLYVLQAY